MTTLAILVTIFGTLAALGFIPQAYNIFQRKSAQDISILTFSFLFINNLFFVLYGFELKSLPIIITNIISAINVGIIIFGWLLYGKKS